MSQTSQRLMLPNIEIPLYGDENQVAFGFPKWEIYTRLFECTITLFSFASVPGFNETQLGGTERRHSCLSASLPRLGGTLRY